MIFVEYGLKKKESHIEIYKIDDMYYGKIVWLANPTMMTDL